MEKIKNEIEKINKIRKELNMDNIKLSKEELKKIENLYDIVDDKEMVFTILKNYYFKSSLVSILDTYIKLEEKNGINNKKILENKVENDVKLTVTSKNVKDIIEEYFGEKFKVNKKYYYNEKNTIGILVMESKYYDRPSYKYWYTYHGYQKEELTKYKESYIMLYFKDSGDALVIPEKIIAQYEKQLNITESNDGIGWHLHIEKENEKYFLRIPKVCLLPLEDYKLKKEKIEVIKISSNFKTVNARSKCY